MVNKDRPQILVIDDTPENLFLLATALESEFDLQLAGSGLEGLELASASPPDLVLLDVMMPGIDGYETFRRIRNQPRLKRVPIIFVTAVSDLESELSGLAMGAADYITKPIKVELVRHRVRNILRLTHMEEELLASEERLRLVMNATGEGIWDWQIKTGVVSHNLRWCQMLGLDDSYLEHPIEEYSARIHPEDAWSVREKLNHALVEGSPYQSEYRLRHSDGHYFWVSDRGNVARRSTGGNLGNPERMVGSITNIQDRKEQEAQIHQLAFYDSLTGLPNRRLLIDRLQQSMIKNQRSKSIGTLMFIDMDRFKQLNDLHGHAMGDALLVEVARRLATSVRAQDTVSRLGGDEFVVMLENMSNAADAAMHNAQQVAETILKNLNKPYLLGEITYASTPSIGVTLFWGGNDSVDAILKRADAAMYQAKAAGRNAVRTFCHTDITASNQ